MRKRASQPVPARPEFCFVKELQGENPPAFSAMESLYRSATELFVLQPWTFLEDSDPIVVRDSVSGELCYCSVMGALGEVFSMHAYIGPQSFRLYRAVAEEQMADPLEFLANLHSVNVEFVPRNELERQDRELLAWLGHPQGRGLACPMFRASRPGYHPWFLTAEEAQTLDECIRATMVVARAILEGKRSTKFWSRADHYPLVTLTSEGEARIESIKSVPPVEPPLPPARLNEETVRQLRAHDYRVGGAIELDYMQTGAPVGKKNERKACTCIGIGADARSGLLYPPEVTDSSVPAGDSLARVFAAAVKATGALPSRVTVRNDRLKQSLNPLLESLGVEVRVAVKLPVVDEARNHLMAFLRGGI